jgi:hypothetical protein
VPALWPEPWDWLVVVSLEACGFDVGELFVWPMFWANAGAAMKASDAASGARL